MRSSGHQSSIFTPNRHIVKVRALVALGHQIPDVSLFLTDWRPSVGISKNYCQVNGLELMPFAVSTPAEAFESA